MLNWQSRCLNHCPIRTFCRRPWNIWFWNAKTRGRKQNVSMTLTFEDLATTMESCQEWVRMGIVSIASQTQLPSVCCSVRQKAAGGPQKAGTTTRIGQYG
jgi:hypothetical protein